MQERKPSSVSMATIKARHSVRSFTDEPINPEQISALNELIAQCNVAGNLHLQLVIDEPNAFGRSKLAHYGKFNNVRNYLCLVGAKASNTEERLGYYGEQFVLTAQAMGLNTCWVGLTFSKKNALVEVADSEKLYALIAIGHGTTQGANHKIKTPQQVAPAYDSAPEWFKRGVDCALLAPTAVNQQKFQFKLLPDNSVQANTAWGFFSRMDLGIAKLHFEIGAADHSVVWAEK